MSLRSRFTKLGNSAFLGWVVACFALAPVQLFEAVRNAGSSAAKTTPWLFTELIGLSLLLWIALTLAVSCYCFGFFFAPAVWLISPESILASRSIWIVASILFGVGLMALRAHVWTALDHDGVGLTNFWLWAAYVTVFFALTAETYCRKLRASANRQVPNL